VCFRDASFHSGRYRPFPSLAVMSIVSRVIRVSLSLIVFFVIVTAAKWRDGPAQDAPIDLRLCLLSRSLGVSYRDGRRVQRLHGSKRMNVRLIWTVWTALMKMMWYVVIHLWGPLISYIYTLYISTYILYIYIYIYIHILSLCLSLYLSIYLSLSHYILLYSICLAPSS
jgi:hypothetical protein